LAAALKATTCFLVGALYAMFFSIKNNRHRFTEYLDEQQAIKKPPEDGCSIFE
jgi:hypothetical protein